MVGVFQSYAVALDGLDHLVDSFLLGDDVLFQFLCHTLQTDTFFLRHALYGDTSHH